MNGRDQDRQTPQHLGIHIPYAGRHRDSERSAGRAVDSIGNVHIAGTGNNRLRKVALGGAIDTIAAVLSTPTGLAFDNSDRFNLAHNLAGTSVYFDQTAAPLILAQAGEIWAVVPATIAGQSSNVTIRSKRISEHCYGATRTYRLRAEAA